MPSSSSKQSVTKSQEYFCNASSRHFDLRAKIGSGFFRNHSIFSAMDFASAPLKRSFLSIDSRISVVQPTGAPKTGSPDESASTVAIPNPSINVVGMIKISAAA